MLFTRGDIVVSMAKLPHLQNQHLKRLWQDPTPANAALFESHVLEPLKKAVQEVESARNSNNAEAETEATAAGGLIRLADLGEPLPAARILEERFRADLGESFLNAEGSDLLPDPTARFSAAVSHLRHYIWGIPRHVLKASLLELWPDAPTLRGEPVRLGDVMAYLACELGSVEESSWTRGALGPRLREMEERGRVQFMYVFLRRTLLAAAHGMPVARTMEVLGRDETLRRLEAARLVAEEIDAARDGEVPTAEAEETPASQAQ